MGKDGKNGSDALVNFANVCAALHIEGEVTGKGLYAAKDDSGNDVIAINASTIFADKAFATSLETVEATAKNLKVEAANIEDLTADKIVLGKNADGTTNNIELTSDGRIKAKNIEADQLEVDAANIKNLTADKIIINSNDGTTIKLDNGKISASSIDADALVAKKIEATTGTIAGFTIADDHLSTEGISSISDDTHDSGVYIGTDGIRLGKTFTVSKEGTVTASGFKIALTAEQKKELAGSGLAASGVRNTFTEAD